MSVLVRSFRKYWILVIILVWVIAWANRDWLAGDVAQSTTEPGAEAVQVATEPAASADMAGVAVADPSVPSVAPVASVGESPPAQALEPVATPLVPAGPTPGTGVASVAVAPEPAPTAAQESPKPEDAVAPTLPGSGLIVEKAPATDVAEVMPSETANAERGVPVAVSETAPLSLGVLQNRVREAQRRQGVSGAIRVLEQVIAGLPTDAAIRADALGELGNLYFTNRQPTEALNAFDRALLALPTEERGAMIRRLTPVYDRFHPLGRSHLEQFR